MCTVAFGQVEVPRSRNQPPPPPPATTAVPVQPAEQVPPQLLLGRRVLHIQQMAAVCNTVVIVNDAASYVQAISHWNPKRRYPVLIDDGTAAAHEDIARFVRGFRPAKVVRWSAKADNPPALDSAKPDVLFSAVAKAWTIEGDHPNQGQLLDFWKAAKYEPPGLVVTQEGDGAWPAALALAAGRGEPLVFIKAKQGVDGSMTIAEADAFEQAIEGAAEVSGFPWKGLGQGLEAVTLCDQAPAKMENGKGEFLALTDRIGRASKGIENGERWAWCGQIFGNPEQSAYRAMCSLFLSPRKAWVFDGYKDSPPWNAYDGTEAAKLLRQVGLQVELDDTPRQGARDWRMRAARAVDADLILINSSGMCDSFNLEPGTCRCGDVPVLSAPAAIHIVHSWSAQYPGARDFLAGRWLERGAFAYAGSVHEPFLQGFIPTPKLATRLMAGAPFGPSVRQDGGQLWRIAVIGDPLFTLGPEVKRVEESPLEGCVEVSEGLREMLTGGQFAKAIDALTLMGRDAQAAELVQSLMKTKPEAFTPEVAAAGVLVLMRAGDNRDVLAAFEKLDAAHAKDPVLRDALWLATYPLLDQPSDELLRTLRGAIRPEQIGRDATELASAWAAKHGRETAEAMLRELRSTLKEKGQQDALDQAMKDAPEKWVVGQ
jgi:hypothetical protein